jgi:diacylglycerol kinase (ATP)
LSQGGEFVTVPEIARLSLEDAGAAAGAGAVPGKITGGRHVFAAFGYSVAGAVRLFRETAFRHELLMAVCLFGLFGYAGAPLSAVMVLGVLLLALFAFEAINTAIEEIVDRVSPEWSRTGRHAKDLGSFAVLCMLVANALYAAATLFPLFMG